MVPAGFPGFRCRATEVHVVEEALDSERRMELHRASFAFDAGMPRDDAGKDWPMTIGCYRYMEVSHSHDGSMYGIYANIWGILMVNDTTYGIHGSYGIGWLINRGVLKKKKPLTIGDDKWYTKPAQTCFYQKDIVDAIDIWRFPES